MKILKQFSYAFLEPSNHVLNDFSLIQCHESFAIHNHFNTMLTVYIIQYCKVWSRIFLKIMLNSAEHEIVPDHYCVNPNNCWHFDINKQGK